MPNRFDRCVAIVLRHEGGYSDHPNDPGGPTNMGITLKTLRDWRGGDVTPADVRALTREEAIEIYRALYWNAVRGEDLPPGVDLAVFDFAVNSGPRRAVRTLQRLLRVRVDGGVGPETLAACRKADREALIRDYCAARLEFLQSLPSFQTFGRGWARRIADIEREALNMARQQWMTLSDAVQTDTGRGAVAVGVLGSIAAFAQDLLPFAEALGRLSPIVAVAVIAATLIGVLMWRARRG